MSRETMHFLPKLALWAAVAATGYAIIAPKTAEEISEINRIRKHDEESWARIQAINTADRSVEECEELIYASCYPVSPQEAMRERGEYWRKNAPHSQNPWTWRGKVAASLWGIFLYLFFKFSKN